MHARSGRIPKRSRALQLPGQSSNSSSIPIRSPSQQQYRRRRNANDSYGTKGDKQGEKDRTETIKMRNQNP